MRRLLVATNNRGKLKEIAAALPDGALSSLSLASLEDHSEIVMPEESGDTFEENAQQKAEFVLQDCMSRSAFDFFGAEDLLKADEHRPAASDDRFAVLADDSGLIVDALPGELGVRSRRYGPGTDQDRCEKLLRALADVRGARRSARFVCALAFAVPDRPTVIVRGTVEGAISERMAGVNGFGYDPLFVPEGSDKTMAELVPSAKQAVSHRARALDLMLPVIRTHFSLEPR